MKLTILGSSAAQPDARDACSGYLITEAQTRVLIDCGTGVVSSLLSVGLIDPSEPQPVFVSATASHAVAGHSGYSSRLRQRSTAIGLSDLDAIVISHMHPDHYLDLVPLRYGLRYGKTGTQPINVWLPPGGTDHLRRLGNCLSMTQPFFEGAFTFHEYLPDVPFTIGGLNVTPVPVRHSVPSHALRIVGSGRTLVYSSDTAPCSDLDEVATGADILLAETTLGTEAFTSGSDLHLGAPDAGRVARVANANRLVLTHFWPGTDREEARFAAMREFSGVVKIAWPHLTMAI